MRSYNRDAIGSANGIILAGGRSTRLGPLAAQISKALVTVGNRPQVVNQILQLCEAGCAQVIVVAGPSTYEQTRDLIARCGFSGIAAVICDSFERGPVKGIMVGMEHHWFDHKRATYVMMADAVIDEPLREDGDWVGVSKEYDDTRSWCYYDRVAKRYRDGLPFAAAPVTIGVYRFNDSHRLYAVASTTMLCNPDVKAVGMAQLLTDYKYANHELFDSWMDVGDVKSLALARRRRFTSRAHHHLVLDKTGAIITKGGVTDAEMDFYDSLGERDMNVQTLFPMHYGTDRSLRKYTIDYIDLPTLAELWLYWPGLPETWAHIIQSLVDRLMHSLWQKEHGERIDEFTAGDWMASKAIERLDQYKPDHGLNESVLELGAIIGDDVWVQGHGDLNFTNILFSINTGAFKLIDPRGGEIPLIYELAKIAYSPIFATVTHGLFISTDDKEMSAWLLPERGKEVDAIYEVLLKYVSRERLAAAVALTLLAAPPLHVAEEGLAFYEAGLFLLKDVLNVCD